MRILVIEDDGNIREFLKTSLTAEGFCVDATSDGEEGSFFARTNDYDLIILDNMLPNKQGFQICQEVRAKGRHVPILILSVYSETSTKVMLLNSGADDYLTKPFSFAELLARVNALLRRPPYLQEKVLAIADLVVDSDKFLVKRGEREIYLTRKEFELLEHMVLNKGKVLSRAILMEHVWDMQADPFSKTIETHIMNLRKKVDGPYATKLIHTIPGRGYKADVRSR
jgi:DNA-binding response OmpR family regulator